MVSHFYQGVRGQVGATRIDRSYHWGGITVLEASYVSVALSDHLSFLVKITVPEIDKILPPQCRPHFKTSPEVIMDKVFRDRLVMELVSWQQVRERGLAIMLWWEYIVKPGIRKLAIQRSKELNQEKRSRMNYLLFKQ